MTLAGKVALHLNLLISLRPYNSHASCTLPNELYSPQPSIDRTAPSVSGPAGLIALARLRVLLLLPVRRGTGKNELHVRLW